MPVFKESSFERVGISLESVSRTVKLEEMPSVRMPSRMSLDALSETSFNIEPPKIDLARSTNRWSISLYKSFEGFIPNLFDPNNEIYFTSWDYSGNPPYVYPSRGTKGDQFILKIKENTKRKFLGDGIFLFPAQQVVGALNIIILVYKRQRCCAAWRTIEQHTRCSKRQ